MDAELKAKWIAALRSGEYKQGREQLNASNRAFCCLGVLCEVEKFPKYSEDFGDRIGYEFPTGETESSLLPENYRQSIGLQAPTAVPSYDNITKEQVGFYTKHEFCMLMNDTESKAFAEIADYIEANF